MRTEKNLVVIGATDEDTAHLRLLMRKAGERLEHRWRWGTEAGADLMVVDPGTFAGQMARTRALGCGKRCAIIADEAPGPNDLLLQRPLKVESVIEVLNRAGGATSMAPAVAAGSGNAFFDIDDSDDGPDIVTRLLGDEAMSSHPPLTPRFTEPPVAGFDEIYRRDEAAEKPKFFVPYTLDDDTRLEAVGDPTERASSRAAESVDALAPQARAAGPNVALPGVKRAATGEGGRHPLSAYLRDALIAGPSRIALDGLPVLTLDPKHGQFYSPGALAELEGYLRVPLARGDWRAVTTAELTQLREQQAARPYSRLVWLDVLVNSGGRLAPQLDPGGTYKVRQRVETGRDFRHHERILRAMQDSARLNEIATDAGVPLGLVFDVVNAYHAIGELEWQSRASLRAPAKPASEGKGGLFSKLKLPFGR